MRNKSRNVGNPGSSIGCGHTRHLFRLTLSCISHHSVQCDMTLESMTTQWHVSNILVPGQKEDMIKWIENTYAQYNSKWRAWLVQLGHCENNKGICATGDTMDKLCVFFWVMIHIGRWPLCGSHTHCNLSASNVFLFSCHLLESTANNYQGGYPRFYGVDSLRSSLLNSSASFFHTGQADSIGPYHGNH
jgi:hypothetical protein